MKGLFGISATAVALSLLMPALAPAQWPGGSTMTNARRRVLMLSWLICACGTAVSQPLLDPTANIPPNSPFLQERYRTPADQGTDALGTIAEVFRFTGNFEDAKLLLSIVERRELKGLLGEPYAPQGTVETAIRTEQAEAESMDALRLRVLRGVTASRIASKGNELSRFDPGVSAPYIGNSIWAAHGERDVLAYLRLSAKNSLAEDIAEITIILEEKASADPYYLAFTCKPEDGKPIPPSDSKPVMCRSREMLARAGTALERLRADRIAFPLVASAIRTRNTRLLVTRTVVGFSGQSTPFADEARRQIAAAASNCSYLGNCGDVQRGRELEEIAQARAERPRNTYLGLLAAAVVLLFLTIPWMTDRRAPASRNTATSLLVGTVVATTLFELFCALLFFRPGLGMEGLVVLPAAGVALIPHVFLALSLGASLRNPEHVSRFRIFILGLAIALPAIGWITLKTAQ